MRDWTKSLVSGVWFQVLASGAGCVDGSGADLASAAACSSRKKRHQKQTHMEQMKKCLDIEQRERTLKPLRLATGKESE